MSDDTAPTEKRRRLPFHLHWRLGRDVSLVILTAFAAVGGVIAASTGIASVSQVTRIAQTQALLLDGSASQSARYADLNPSNRHLTLVSGNRREFVDIVVGSSNEEGWVLGGNLGSAGDGRRYQLWTRTPNGVIAMGSAGQAIGPRYFTLPVGATVVFLTSEPATGSIQPTGDVIVQGTLP